MLHITVGTAGHIDHGKSTLIEALTGINPDRLKEEQERGITIDLGFAHLETEDVVLHIIDVPGHERFVKNMVAGAGTIDLMLMVIAADESVMPQTREHFDICELLQVKNGIIALTKTDLVDEEWLELVIEDIHDFCQGTFCQDVPILPVSAKTGTGLDNFKRELFTLAATIKPKASDTPLRLPIDRVFTIKGFGAVITGTLVSGKVTEGQNVTVLPQHIDCKVRGVEVHSQKQAEAQAGERTALNLGGVNHQALERGNIVIEPNAYRESIQFDVRLNLLPEAAKALRFRQRVRFHHHTSEVMGRVYLYGDKRLQPGESCFGQLVLEAPIVPAHGDHFIIRQYSPLITIGGGTVLNPFSKPYRKQKNTVLPVLEKLASDNISEVVEGFILSAGYEGLDFNELGLRMGLYTEKVKAIVDTLQASGLISLTTAKKPTCFHRQYVENGLKFIDSIASRLHRKSPLRKGFQVEELKSQMPKMTDEALFSLLLEISLEKGILEQREQVLALSTWTPQMKPLQEALLVKLESMFKKAGFQPPFEAELKQQFSDQSKDLPVLLEYLVEEGKLVKIDRGFYMWRERLEWLLNWMSEQDEPFKVTDVKNVTNMSRKFCIPVMEYCDNHNYTRRDGDFRVWTGNNRMMKKDEGV